MKIAVMPMNPVCPAPVITNSYSRDHTTASPPPSCFRLCGMSGQARPRTIAVLGGGISGLTAAYSLSRSLLNHRIIVLEASSRLGGWVHSERVRVHEPPVQQDATALLESGPRSLMPGKYKGIRTLEMVRSNRSLYRLRIWALPTAWCSFPAPPSPPRTGFCIMAGN